MIAAFVAAAFRLVLRFRRLILLNSVSGGESVDPITRSTSIEMRARVTGCPLSSEVGPGRLRQLCEQAKSETSDLAGHDAKWNGPSEPQRWERIPSFDAGLAALIPSVASRTVVITILKR